MCLKIDNFLIHYIIYNITMNLLYNLPQEVQTKIWQYDITYRDKLQICLMELEFYTPFWKSKNDITKHFRGYDNYYNSCKKISKIINNTRYYYSRGDTNIKTVHIPEFLSDVSAKNYLIFNNIRSKKWLIKSQIKKNSIETWLKNILKYT